MPKTPKLKTAKKPTERKRLMVKNLPAQAQELTGRVLKKVKGGQDTTQMESRKFQT